MNDQPPSDEAVKAAFAVVESTETLDMIGACLSISDFKDDLEMPIQGAARILAAHARALQDGVATGTEGRVCKDISSRQVFGLVKYDTSIEDAGLSHKEWLNHAYLETLDKAIYLKAAIEKESGLESEVARLREALEKIADQKLSDELDDEQTESADFEFGYDEVVRDARKALTGEASA